MQRFDPFTLPLHGLRAIEASAGTGKTWSITLLHLRLILQGTEIERILVTTFTRAATAELRERLRERLASALRLQLRISSGEDDFSDEEKALVPLLSQSPETEGRLRQALSDLDLAPIFTIHSLAKRLLDENAATLGLDPDTQLVSDTLDLEAEIIDDLFVQHPDIFVRLDRDDKDLLKAVKLILNQPDAAITPREMADPEVMKDAQQEYCQIASRINPDAMSSGISHGGSRKAVMTRLQKMRDGEHVPWDKFEQKDKITPALVALWQELELAHEKIKEQLNLMKAAPFILLASELPKRLAGRKRELGIRSFDDLMRCVRAALRDPQRGPTLAVNLRQRFGAILIDEFQDTDAVQAEVFTSVFASDPAWLLSHPFLLIGDPKQSIYQFRGADLASYQNLVAQATVYTMDTNHRSDGQLIEALNDLYRRAGESHGEQVLGLFPGPGRPIAYLPVKAAHAERRLLSPDGRRSAVLPSLRLEVLEDPLDRALSTQRLAERSAAAIAQQLNLPPEQRLRIPGKNGDSRPVVAADFAVLAHRRDQLESVQRELRKFGIPSVFNSRQSVFATFQAKELLLLLRALSPGELGSAAACAALATPLLGFNDAQLLLFRDARAGDQLAAHLQRFRRWSELLTFQGPMPLIDRILDEKIDQETSRRELILAGQEGERIISNWQHLAELTQEIWANRHLRDADALALWLERKLVGDDDDGDVSDAAAQLVRLETQEDAVHLVTIHAAKGLEYGVVYCPFLWDLKSRSVFMNGQVFFADGRLDLGSSDQPSVAAAQWRVMQEEQARLLYVALTRARHQLVLGFALTEENAQHGNASLRSWLARLLFAAALGEGAKPDFDAAQNQLLERVPPAPLERYLWHSRADGLSLDLATAAPPSPTPIRHLIAPPDLQESRGRERLKLSFSVLHKQGRGDDSEATVLTSGGADEPVLPESPLAPVSGFSVNQQFSAIVEADPRLRGKELGVLVHSILEDVLAHESLASDPATALRHSLPRHLEPACAESLFLALQQVLLHPMPLPGALTPCRLSDLRHKAAELEFLLPFREQALSSEVLVKALRHPQRGDESFWNQWATRFAGVKTPPVHFLEGVIDLIFQHEGRWYVLDYKTNGGCGGGTEAELERIMLREDYILQSYLYTLAWHRRLQASLGRRYQYERDFGGIVYLFLRALPDAPEPGDSRGLWIHKPEARQIRLLESLLNPAETQPIAPAAKAAAPAPRAQAEQLFLNLPFD